MGREVVVGIYDKLNNSYNLDVNDDWFICGRDDFTNDLYSLFINREVYFLILDIYNQNLDGVLVKNCKDENHLDEETNDAMFINESKVEQIIDEHIKEVNKEREDLSNRIHSLEKARDGTRTLQDWLDIDTFLHELMKDGEDLKWSGQEGLQTYLDEACDECRLRLDNTLALSYDPISNTKKEQKEGYRYFPIILFSE